VASALVAQKLTDEAEVVRVLGEAAATSAAE
jgi:hypothetical protein